MLPPKLGGSVMDPGISASRLMAVLVLGYLSLAVLLRFKSKVKEKGMSGGREGPEKEKSTRCCGWHLYSKSIGYVP
jgi:hypothetical protein